MFNRKVLLTAFLVVLLGFMAASSTRAFGTLNRTMYVTFSGPVQLPGVQLGAGKYTFELVDPISAADVVRVSSWDRKHVYLTAFTDFVQHPAGLRADQVILLGEAPAGSAPPIKIWYPSDTSTGRAFRY